MASAASHARERERRLSQTEWEDAGPSGSLFGGGPGSIQDIWGHRELLAMLTRRELKSRYKDSTLGFLWSLARPLTQLLIYYVVVGKFLGAERSLDNFAVYIFAGLTIYTLFSEIVATGTGSIVDNAGLVKKVYLPREVFPIASIGSALFNFAIQLAILIATSLFVGTFALSMDLFYALGALLITLIYGLAFALILSALNVYLRDIKYLVEVVLLLLMWGSPIVYSWHMVADIIPGWALAIYLNNPITVAVLGFQQAFWAAASNGDVPDGLALQMVVVAVIGLILVAIAQRVFSRLQGNFAQEL